MADVLTPEMLGFIGGFGPGEPPADTNPAYNDQDTTDTSTEVIPEEKKVDKVATVVETPKQSLADLLRADREARNNKSREDNEVRGAKEELTKVKSELETLRNAPAFENDPVGYVKAKRLTPAQQIALGEALIYDLAPDKAPPDLRLRLFEQKREREDRLREDKAKEDSAHQQMDKIQRDLESFTQEMEYNARNLQSGSFPESEDWFSTDSGLDHATYVQSLVATAKNLATTATNNRTRADLSFANIAKVLDTEISRRMAIRDSKRSKRTASSNETVAPIQNRPLVKTERVETASGKGLNSGFADNPAYDDAERIRRAVRAGFTK